MKAVLVMEMPESCEECPLCRHDTFEQLGCSAQNHVINFIIRMVGQKKPRWCPLRPMLKEIPSRDGMVEDEYKDGYRDGWNECVESIEGDDTNAAKDDKEINS